MIDTVIVISALTILAILFWPRRSPHVRRVTKSFNGRPYGKGRELY